MPFPNAGFVNNVPVGPYSADQLEIQRKQQLANLLQQQSLSPVEAPPQHGMFASPISPLAVGAKAFEAYRGGQLRDEANKGVGDLYGRMQAERKAALANALKASSGAPAETDAADNIQTPAVAPNPASGLASLAQSNDPSLMAQYAPIFNMQQAQQKQQQEQQFKASESAEARKSREQMAEEARKSRDAIVESQRADRLAAEQRAADLRREFETGRREDRRTSAEDRKAEKENTRQEKMGAEKRAAKLRLDAIGDQYDRLEKAAKELHDHPGLPRITGVLGSVPDYPGSDAANARARFETLKSQVALSVLQSIRDNSKTGGAVGQVSNFEQKMFQNNLAALANSQDYPSMQAALKQIEDFAAGSRKRMDDAYRTMYEPAEQGGSSDGWSIKPLP